MPEEFVTGVGSTVPSKCGGQLVFHKGETAPYVGSARLKDQKRGRHLQTRTAEEATAG